MGPFRSDELLSMSLSNHQHPEIGLGCSPGFDRLYFENRDNREAMELRTMKVLLGYAEYDFNIDDNRQCP